MTDSVIDIADVSKRFMIRFNPNPSIKSRFVGIFNPRYREKATEFWALRDIELTVRAGDSIGIIGPNGSGKSTLFKLIAGVMAPTTGTIRTRGRISPLIELGVGFHPELTGSENVYLNTSFYGITRKDTDKLFQDILEFSEIGDFINVPIKNYSSGMVMRLAFSIAIYTVPDILLVDEILAVGDAAFSEKCLAKMKAFMEEGRTFVLVSHSGPQIVEMCKRTILLWKGRIIAEGPSAPVVEKYADVLSNGGPDWEGIWHPPTEKAPF